MPGPKQQVVPSFGIPSLLALDAYSANRAIRCTRCGAASCSSLCTYASAARQPAEGSDASAPSLLFARFVLDCLFLREWQPIFFHQSIWPNILLSLREERRFDRLDHRRWLHRFHGLRDRPIYTLGQARWVMRRQARAWRSSTSGQRRCEGGGEMGDGTLYYPRKI